MDGLQRQVNEIHLYERLAAIEARLDAIDRLLKTAVETMTSLAATDSALLDTAKALGERIDGVETGLVDLMKGDVR